MQFAVLFSYFISNPYWESSISHMIILSLTQNWTDRWYDWGRPVRRQEELPLMADRHEPLSRPWQYGVHHGQINEPKWTRQDKDWPINEKKYLRLVENGWHSDQTCEPKSLKERGSEVW